MRPCFVAFPPAWRRRFEGLCSGSASYSGPQLTPPRNERSRRSAVPCMPDVKIWGEQIFAYLLTYAAVSAIISVRSDPPIYFCEHLFEKTVFRIRRVRAELKGVPAGLSGPVGAICKPKKRPKARETGTENRTYIAIDLKSFYASAECVARGLDPLSVNLVVADAGRTEKTICLAVSPALKSFGIQSRPRLFEVISTVREINAFRRSTAPGGRLTGSSCDRGELESSPCLAVDFITAPPRMAYYMETSMKIYGIYLKYIAPEDIHVYSIDEVFIDATGYLRTYGITARQLAVRMIKDVLAATGITATAGIGTNLYLCKVAMDIEAKRAPADADGVRIAQLDEESYRRRLWSHRPLTDFWRVGRGYAKKLEKYGLYTMGDIARCSLGTADEFLNEALLYKLFGVNAELLIDHAWGWEPCTMADIKSYRPSSESICAGQVLSGPYEYSKALLIAREMAESLAMQLFASRNVTDGLTLTVGYDAENLADPERKKSWKGPVTVDHYGRSVPAHAHGTVRLERYTSYPSELVNAVSALFGRITDKTLLVRRINITANNVRPEPEPSDPAQRYVQLGLFDFCADGGGREEARLRERRLQEALLSLSDRYGEKVVFRCADLQEGATARERARRIGGHRA